MKRLVALAAIFAALSSSALAGGMVGTSCYHNSGGVSCYTTFTGNMSNSPRVIEGILPTWTKEEDAKWVAFCKPEKRIDSLGITRLSYAHEGCGFGRSE